jgi:NAD(P)H-hydrate epimerase
MIVLSKEEMREADYLTINKIGIPNEILMENAGKSCADFIVSKFSNDKKILVFCGTGNNGGDGFVISRWLSQKEFSVKIILIGNMNKMSKVTKLNYRLTKLLDITTLEYSNKESIVSEINTSDIIIDAIFGIGFYGKVAEPYLSIFREINLSSKTKISIDIASGIDSNTGNLDSAIKADYTLTISFPKYGQLIGKGREFSGEILNIDIGIPMKIIKQIQPKANLITNLSLPVRNKFSHKGVFGKIGIIAGSPGYSGAGIMAGKSALKAGAGLVTLIHPQEMNFIFETQIIEAMTFGYSKKNYLEEIKNKISGMDAILIGPGLGTSQTALNILKMLLSDWAKPLVIDADGINILSLNKELLEFLADKDVVITPHVGEFSRLVGKTVEEINDNPIQNIKNFYDKSHIPVLLKSFTSIFYDGDSLIFNISGNDALSTGGSGDVLAGIIISLLGQKMSIKEASVNASFILGKTAELVSEKMNSTRKVLPSDIIENLLI